ncbi:MAG: molybdenum cofactor biosynthesis protein MoaB [Thermoplasmata archaeon]|nr:molybdenum cofactor biosynthesis protein MoaB [Thermoplasmata archaeon]
MGVEEHKKHAIKNIKFAVFVVSDTRNEKTDESGKLIKELIEKKGHNAVEYKIIKNDEKEIINALQCNADAIVFCGGTGISKKDITIDVVKPLLQKELPGFGEMFRILSMEEIGTAAIMSRATAGIIDGKAVFCIPGSKNAVKTAMKKIILEECGHILWEARR